MADKAPAGNASPSTGKKATTTTHVRVKNNQLSKTTTSDGSADQSKRAF